MSDKNYRLTVLCTAYNHEKYLAEALESFLRQKTDFAFQVLVNDDCSSDGTADILRDYARRYPDIIKAFCQEENLFSKGPEKLYDQVFYSRLDTPYVAYCEGDDCWLDENKLQQQVDFLDAHSEYSACVHNTTLRYCGAERPDALLLPESGGDRDLGFDSVVQGMSHAFHTSSIVARSEYVLNPPDYYYTAAAYGFMDYAIAVRLALAGPIRFIDRPMSLYRISSNPGAWSAKLDRHYARLREFVAGEVAMLEKLLPRLNEAQRRQAEKVIIERKYELMDIRGQVDELIKPPYLDIYRSKPLSYRAKTTVKRLFPAFHRWHRRRQGYGD